MTTLPPEISTMMRAGQHRETARNVYTEQRANTAPATPKLNAFSRGLSSGPGMPFAKDSKRRTCAFTVTSTVSRSSSSRASAESTNQYSIRQRDCIVGAHPVQVLAPCGLHAIWQVTMNDEMAKRSSQKNDSQVQQYEQLKVAGAALRMQAFFQ